MAATLGLMPDYAEEGWPSMDLCAEMLHAEASALGWEVHELRPPFRSRLQSLPLPPRFGFNVDRLLNRHIDFPRSLKQRRGLDAYHIVDHSYAHLALTLPPERTGVYCHDLDLFACLLGRARRPAWFRSMARRTLRGLQRASVVFHSTLPVRDDVLANGLLDGSRLVHVPYGAAVEFRPEGPRQSPADGAPYLLHVGSCIPRKRVDVLLRAFAIARTDRPELRLVQVGGTWEAEHVALIDSLRLTEGVLQVRGISRLELAAWYRGAHAVLVTSEGEGFGLPVIEALACGAPVVASDIPPLREIGGSAVAFCPVGDAEGFAMAQAHVNPTARAERLAQAARFSWRRHTEAILGAYARLAGNGRPA